MRKRFGVYRNNVIAGLVSSLAARFPVVGRLVGDEFFGAMARCYVIDQPPRSPVLLLYGDTFPEFIENFVPAGSIEYLADVARLEFAKGRAYHATDASPLHRKIMAALRADRLNEILTQVAVPYSFFAMLLNLQPGRHRKSLSFPLIREKRANEWGTLKWLGVRSQESGKAGPSPSTPLRASACGLRQTRSG